MADLGCRRRRAYIAVGGRWDADARRVGSLLDMGDRCVGVDSAGQYVGDAGGRRCHAADDVGCRCIRGRLARVDVDCGGDVIDARCLAGYDVEDAGSGHGGPRQFVGDGGKRRRDACDRMDDRDGDLLGQGDGMDVEVVCSRGARIDMGSARFGGRPASVDVADLDGGSWESVGSMDSRCSCRCCAGY